MDKVIKSRLRELVEEKRQEWGFVPTQTQIAEATGIRQPTISAWMSDKPIGRVDAKVLMSLASWLGLQDPMDLLLVTEGRELDSPELMAGAA